MSYAIRQGGSKLREHSEQIHAKQITIILVAKHRMHIHLITIFPEIFDNFINTSLIKKAKEKKILTFNLVNPRQFCPDRHQTVDDKIYGGWAWLLMKAKPAIEAVELIIKKYRLSSWAKSKDIKKRLYSSVSSEWYKTFNIILLSPAKKVFTQKQAHALSNSDHLIFVCTRYEWIDYRFEQYMKKKYPKNFEKISLGQFITLGGEVPAMMMIEAITRLIPGVIKEESSRQDESYNIKENMNNLEYPQYTHPEEVLWMKVPKILLSWHHKNIENWRKNKTKKIKR